MSNLNEKERQILDALEADFNKGRRSPLGRSLLWLTLSLVGLGLLVVSVTIPTAPGILVGAIAFGIMVLGVYKAIEHKTF